MNRSATDADAEQTSLKIEQSRTKRKIKKRERGWMGKIENGNGGTENT